MKTIRKTIDRRTLLKSSAIASIASAALGRSYDWKPRVKQGIVCFLVPGMRHDSMGCAGHPFVKTPHIDRIRSEGSLFKNAYSVTSSRSPSLASILTGSYPHKHGVVNDRECEIGDEVPYLPALLERLDFTTAVIKGDPNEPFCQEAIDRVIGEAEKFLNKNRKNSFCLFIELPSVEPPIEVPSPFADLFKDQSPAKPTSWDDTFENKPFWQRRKNPWIVRNLQEVPTSKESPEWNPKNDVSLDYLRAVTAIDASVGRVLQVLDITNRVQDSLLVFAGTHGSLLGEHRLTGGRYAYEESIHCPLIIHCPGNPYKSEIEELALSIDIAPTLLEWIWPESPEKPFQGTSLFPLLKGKNEDWRKDFLYEYWMSKTPLVPQYVAIRSGDCKYIHYPELNDFDELYDLGEDPYELNNLISNLVYTSTKISLKKKFMGLLEQTGYKHVEPPREKAPVSETLPRGLLINYTFDKIENGIVANKSLFPIHAPFGQLTTTAGFRGMALGLQKDQYLEIPPSSLLNLAVGSWAVDIRLKAETDGTVLSHGSGTNHYAVFVENGIPCISIRKDAATIVLSDRENRIGQWINLRANLNENSATLTINHQRVDQMSIPGGFNENHCTIRLGANPEIYGDPKKMQGDLPALRTGFAGAIDSLKIIRQ